MIRNLCFLILLPLAILVSCQSHSTKSTVPNTYKIGINLTLSGPAANWGNELKKGIDLAITAYNDSCTKKPIQLIYEDNQFNTRQAVSITKKLIEVDQVDLIISGYTPIIKATADIVNDKGVPLLATLSSAEGITLNRPWVFRDFVLESDYMPMLATYAYEAMGHRKGSFLVINDDYGLDAKKYFSGAFEQVGGQMLDGAFFDVGDMDLRTKIGKILSDNPDFVLVAGRGSAMINACRQLHEMNADLQILSTTSINDRNIWKGIGESGEGIVFAEITVDESDAAFVRANERCLSAYNDPLNWVNIYGYSIGAYLSNILSEVGPDKDRIQSALKNLDVYSIRGPLLMNGDQEVDTPLSLSKHEKGLNIRIDK